MAEIGKAIGLDIVTDLIQGVTCGDEFLTGWRINAIETRVSDRRRADTHMDLFRPSLSDHMHQFLTGGPTDNRVIYHHDTFISQKTLDRVKFNFHAKMPNGLLWLNKRAPHIVIADEPCIKGNPCLLRIPQCRRNARVWHRNHHIGLHGRFTGELSAKRLTHQVHVVAKDIAIWTRKVNEFEDTRTGQGWRKGKVGLQAGG